MILRPMTSVTIAAALLVAGSVSVAGPATAAQPGHPDGTYSLDSTSEYLRGFVKYEDGQWGSADMRDAAFLITQTSISDDETPSAEISRSVDLGDGFPAHQWTGTGPKQVVYSKVGTYTPKVSLTDGDGNTTIVVLPSVTVKSEEQRPVLRITRPVRSHKVAAWRTIRGVAFDEGIGLSGNGVTVRVWQKRSGRWYGYSFSTKQWIKGKTTFAATRKMSFNSRSTVHAQVVSKRWATPQIRGLRAGYLHVWASTADRLPISTNVSVSSRIRR